MFVDTEQLLQLRDETIEHLKKEIASLKKEKDSIISELEGGNVSIIKELKGDITELKNLVSIQSVCTGRNLYV